MVATVCELIVINWSYKQSRINIWTSYIVFPDVKTDDTLETRVKPENVIMHHSVDAKVDRSICTSHDKTTTTLHVKDSTLVHDSKSEIQDSTRRGSNEDSKLGICCKRGTIVEDIVTFRGSSGSVIVITSRRTGGQRRAFWRCKYCFPFASLFFGFPLSVSEVNKPRSPSFA